MGVVNRTYTPRTTRLLAEYLAVTYPHAKVFQEMHLTRVNPAAVAAAGKGVSPRFGGVTMGFADAAVILPLEVGLWEAKDRLTQAGISQLASYGLLWPLSYESTLYPGSLLTLHLLCANDDSTMHENAVNQGVSVVVYAPAWYTASVAASERNTAVRVIAALAEPVLELVAEGHLSSAAAVAKLVSLGMDRDSAVQRVENALLPAPAPNP